METKITQLHPNATPTGLCKCKIDNEYTVVYLDDLLYQFLGYTEQEFFDDLENNLSQVIHQEDFSKLKKNVEDTLDHSVTRYQFRVICKDGSIRWVSSLGQTIQESGERYLCMMFLAAKEERFCIEPLKDENAEYQYILSDSDNIILEWDYETKSVAMSDYCTKLLGCCKEMSNFPESWLESSFIHPEDEQVFEEIFAQYKLHGDVVDSEFRLKNHLGEYHWFSCTAKAIYNGAKKLTRVLIVLVDIEENKKIMQGYFEQAVHDSLTGLLNNQATKDKIQEHLLRKTQQAALLVVDIDEFKKVNDNFGHIYGDAVIAQIASNLKNIFRKDDVLGRVGGDEFVVFMPDVKNVQIVAQKAKTIVDTFAKGISVGDKDYHISLSVGVALAPSHGENYQRLFHCADTALYYAKNNGKNQYCVYSEEINRIWSMLPYRKEAEEELPANQKSFGKNVLEYVIQILQEKDDINISIPVLLDLIGKFMGLQHIYIYERSWDGKKINKIFQWYESEDEAAPQLPSVLQFEDSFACFIPYDRKGNFYCPNVSKMEEGEGKNWLVQHGAVSAAICCARFMENSYLIAGFECLVENSALQDFYEILSAITITMSLFVKNQRQNQYIKNREGAQVYGNSTKLFSYVVDKNTYKINKLNFYNLQTLEVEEGDICYREIMNRETPCPNCPILRLQAGDQVAISEIQPFKSRDIYEVMAKKLEKKENQYHISVADISYFYTDEKKCKSDVLELYTDLLKHYYGTQNLDSVMKLFAPQVVCYDSAMRVLAKDSQELRKVLQSVRKKYTDPFHHEIVRCFVDLSQDYKKATLYSIVYISNSLKDDECYEIRHVMTYEKINGIYKIVQMRNATKASITKGSQALQSYQESRNAKQLDEIQTVKEHIQQYILCGYLEENLPVYFINEDMCYFLGYEDEADFVQCTDGKLFQAIYSEDRYGIFVDIREQLIAKGKFHVEFRIHRKDGSLIWVRCVGNQLFFPDKRKVFVGLCHDISEQKKLENQLAIYESTSRGGTFIMNFDRDFTLLYANDIFYQILGYTKHTFSQQLENKLIQILNPEKKEIIRKTIGDAIQLGRSSIEFETQVQTYKNREKYLSFNAAFQEKSGGWTLYGFVVDITEKYLLSSRIEKNEELYRIALAQTNLCVWEYDIINKKIHNSQGAMERHGFNYDLENIPDFLFMIGYVHPDSISAMKGMYQRLEMGESRVTGCFRLRNNMDNDWWWERITYTTVYDKQGKPIRAIALGEDITDKKNAEIQYQQDIYTKNLIAKDNLLSMQVDLSKGVILRGYMDEIHYTEKDAPFSSYIQFMEYHQQSMCNKEDVKRYNQQASREALLRAFATGKDDISFDFSIKYVGGSLIWVRHSIKLVRDAITDHVCAYVNVQNIQEKKTMELSLRMRAEKDALTGVYNKDTLTIMAEDSLKQKYKMNQRSAIIVVNMDDYSDFVSVEGFDAADNVIREIAHLLIAKFGTNQIIGRFYGDEFVVVINEEMTRNAIKNLAEDARKTICMPYMFREVSRTISVSMGIVFTDGREESFRGLYEKAKSAMKLAKSSGKNQCTVYSSDLLNATAKEQVCGKAEGSEVNYLSNMDSVLLKCAFLLAGSHSFNAAMGSVMHNIAEYYEADSAYIVETNPTNREVQNLQGWSRLVSDGELPVNILDVQQMYKDWIVESAEEGIVIVEEVEKRKNTHPKEYMAMGKRNISTFCLSVYQDEGKIIGFVMIENVKKNLYNQLLMEYVNHFIKSEVVERQCRAKEDYHKAYDVLTGLYNRSSYMEYRSKVNEEVMLSLGIVSVDINGLKILNSTHGHVYSDSVIQEIAKKLQSYFPEGLNYRIAGDEFLTICQNISKVAFEQRLSQLKAEWDLEMDGLISMGYIWSDTDMQMDRLINYAEEKRLIAKQSLYQLEKRSGKMHNPEELQKLQNSLEKQEFKVYLQPKASIETREIVGAEALVRLLDPQYGLIFPDKFISKYEREGIIRYVDLFVFEQVCMLLERWIKEGRKALIISLNLSRITLMDENIVELLNEIHSRYDVPKQYIEIEVTESVGTLERDMLINVGNAILCSGYRISLDDFGSKYSNLAIVSTMKLNSIKIDKSLVNDIFSNNGTRIIVHNFLVACRQMGIESVAEGVETVEQLETLKELGCDIAQGYYFNKPIPVTDFEEKYVILPENE